MPNATIVLADTYEQIQRRVAVGISRQLARIMRLPKETMINIPGESETTPMNGGSFQDCCADVKFPASTKILLTFAEEVDESTSLTTAVKTKQNFALFLDPVRNITIRPITRNVKMVCTIKMTGQSGPVVHKWVDELRTRFSAGRVEIPIELEYHYSLPDRLHEILMALHATANKSSVQLGEFKDWFHEHTPVATTVVTTLTDGAPRLVYVERQLDSFGWFDYQTGPPNPERDGDDGAWSSSVSFTVMYSRPHEFFATWPLLVHNQVVPKAMRPRVLMPTQFERDRRVSRLKGALDKPSNDRRWLGQPYLRVPAIDDWPVPAKQPARCVFFTGLAQLKDDDKRTLLDLTKLDKLQLHPAILEYYRHKGPDAIGSGRGIFEYTLYQNNEYMGSNLLTLTNDGLVKATVDLDITKYYHVQISLVTNWYELTNDTKQCLRRYPTVFMLLARALRSRRLVKLVGTNYERSVSVKCPGEGEWGPGAITKGIVAQETVDEVTKETNPDALGNAIGPLTVMEYELVTYQAGSTK